MTQSSDALPPPGLEPQEINLDQYHAHTPEKIELWEGYVFGPADYPDDRRRMLRLLLVNMGSLEVVRLAPEAFWREALDRVYGRPAV
jgi:hypothetical protein